MRWLRRAPRTLPSLEAYALWAEGYAAAPHNVLMEIEQRAMVPLLHDLAGKVVLDLACGTGRYGAIASARGAIVIGLDNSLAMVKRVAWQGAGVATCEALPLADASVDVIICGMALGHLPSLQPALQEIARVLKPHGSALISDFHPFQFLTGAQRTFRTSTGRVYAVEHHVHLFADYFQAIQCVGLHLDTVLEPLYAHKPVVLILKVSR